FTKQMTLGQLCSALWYSKSRPVVIQPGIKTGSVVMTLAPLQCSVRSLEAANSKLELQIKEFYEMRSPTHKKDLSGFHTTISDILNQIQARSVENSQMILRVLQNQITTSTTEVKTSRSQVTDLKRTFQSLEIELHGLRHLDTRQEVRKVIVVEKIQEIQQVQEVVEEYHPHMQKRVRVIVEEMVDGKVVSTSVDEKVQDMN
uniref:Uncharacterized protein n=1 Tax=Oncorhynchus tshawytscha TaxID=74940 RepID=A0A8C8H0A2_ONCTS